MLFDLRSRGRRRTVQTVYLGLALLMGGGLVLFGVGAGNGFGGILNAFTGSGSGNSQQQVLEKQEKSAVKVTQQRPSDPSAWLALAKARYSLAGAGSNYNTNVISSSGSQGDFTSSGLKELTSAGTAWQQYTTLTKTPDSTWAQTFAQVYDRLSNFGQAAAAWQIVTAANPSVSLDYQQLAVSAYKAKQTRLGDLATAKALSLTPKSLRTSVKTQIDAAAGLPTTGTTPSVTTSTTPTTTSTTATKSKSKPKK
jgi:hypothetical protein